MIQKLDYPNNGGKGTGLNPRIETGAVQFGDDWPGYFMRGDQAFHIAVQIKILLDAIKDPPPEAALAIMCLRGLKDDIVQNTIMGEHNELMD